MEAINLTNDVFYLRKDADIHLPTEEGVVERLNAAEQSWLNGNRGYTLKEFEQKIRKTIASGANHGSK